MLPFRVTVLSAVLLLTGCTPYTYINIPSQVGDVAQHSPNSATARQLQHLALVALLAKSPLDDGLFQVILPVGSTQLHLVRRRHDGRAAQLADGLLE